jgi:hypothetical protein
MERVTVPFSLENYAADLRSSVTVRGVVRMEPDAIVIEFRETTTSLATLSESSGGIRIARIPLDDVESVDVVRRWFRRPILRIRTRTLSALESVPGAAGNECRLPIRGRERLAAREFAVSTTLLLSGRELRRIEDGE